MMLSLANIAISTISTTTIVAAIGYLFSKWFEARIKNGIQFEYDKKIEAVKSEYNQKLEVLKSDLQAKQTEISSLRSAVIAGRANRSSIVDKRKIEAVEKVWNAVQAASPYTTVSTMMSAIDFEGAAGLIEKEPKVREFFEIITKHIDLQSLPDDPAVNERPFVTPLVWAYWSAYRTIVMGAFARAKMLALGTKSAGMLWNVDNVKDILKATLPHKSDFIEKSKFEDYHHLLIDIEELLLDELQRILDGRDIDIEDAKRATHINEIISEMNKKTQDQSAPTSLGA